MKEINLEPGMILVDNSSGERLRIVSVFNGMCTGCCLDTQKLGFKSIPLFEVLQNLYSSKARIEIEEDDIHFDLGNYDEECRKDFALRKLMVNKLVEIYGPTYIELANNRPKPIISQMIAEYGCSRSTFWRMVRKYFQSGMKEKALLDFKHFPSVKKAYISANKPGRKSNVYGDGYLLTEQDIKNFDEALKKLKSSGKHYKNKIACYNEMNDLHYRDVYGRLLPQSQRPTVNMFYYYLRKNLSKEDFDKIKMGSREYENNCRLLNGDTFTRAKGPAHTVEIDAIEADISLVGVQNPDGTVGRPTVYVMIDDYTRLIMAVSVAFDQNSVQGVTNLFLNLADDKVEYCREYGLEYDADYVNKVWPSGVLPARLMLDRGSEFVSKEFDRICNELCIEKCLIEPGKGSLKGVVEQNFHQMMEAQRPWLEQRGLITKRHDSNHHYEAILNERDYTQLVINYVLYHNQKFQKSLSKVKEFIDAGVDVRPYLIWKYGVERVNCPRPITDKVQYCYNLLTPVNFKVSRKGIMYKGLIYDNPDDKWLQGKRVDAGERRVSFPVRIDCRDISRICYMHDNRIYYAALSSKLISSFDYTGLSFNAYDIYYKLSNLSAGKAREKDEELAANLVNLSKATVTAAEKLNKRSGEADAKHIRSNRFVEKELKSASNSVIDRMVDKDELALEPGKDATPFDEKEDKAVNKPSDIPDIDWLEEDPNRFVSMFIEFENED